MKLWLFGTYKWQGNPKALFMYMNKHYKKNHELWWIADNKEDAQKVKSLGFNSTYLNSNISNYLFKNADVYVNENFRQTYPSSMSDNITILNTWHGVGIKHIELGLGMESALSQDIMKKYIKNTDLYKKNTLFLSTSSFMDQHFKKDTLIDSEHFIKGPYPRNIVYKDSDLTQIDNYTQLSKLDDYNKVYLFAPTYRYKQINGVFSSLIPDLAKLNRSLANTNSCMIIKVHPFMTKDPEYQYVITNQHEYSNIILWNDEFDIYEIFNKIDIGIVDYSSIFYDLLEAGVEKYIRYIPDYDEYINDSELIADYFENTDGEIANSYNDLLTLIEGEIKPVSNIENLLNKFFEHGKNYSIDSIINEADSFTPKKVKLPELHTFDIFDTLFRRKTLEPRSIFFKVQQNLRRSEISFPKFFVEEYPKIRHQVEMDLRDIFRKTVFERETDKLEISLYELLKRLQENFELSNEQVDFLFKSEVEEEIENVEPIDDKIEELFLLKANGHEIVLLSDMYLPENIIKEMLMKVDKRFNSIKLYVSSEIGYQKSTGKLYEYLFFNVDSYNFTKWVHHGDNNHADGNVPRRYGIKTIVHDMDNYIPFEKYLINESTHEYKWDSYKIATKIQRFRWECLNAKSMTFDDKLFYSFAYIGSAFVPYVHWAIKHAIKQGYEILYFISRDGHFLKEIADVLIKELNLPIKTKYIYGSRKAWRVASFINKIDDESFTPFGMFSNITNFDDLVSSSQISKEKLLDLIPSLNKYQEKTIGESDLIEIRRILSESYDYHNEVLKLATEKRKLVTKYLKENIDFSQKFAFVEFWGRGYTQDTLTRLLDNAAGKKVINPFYYIRNFTPNFDNSIRHRFTVKPSNYSYFEPIFAQTPYLSIPGYENDDYGNVKPLIIPQENEFHESISDGIKRFAKMYAELVPGFTEDYERNLADLSYSYQFANPTDYYIATVFSKFKDNIGMYGKTREFAPQITEHDLKTIGINNIRLLTRNLEMSVARSSDSIRKRINAHYRSDYKGLNKYFIINDLNKYIQIDEFPKYIINKKDQPVFENVNWSTNSKSTKRIGKGEIVKAVGYEWTHSGVPRIRIEDGFITASTEFIGVISDVKLVYSKGEQTLYRLSDLKDEIYVTSENEKLDVLDYAINSNNYHVLLTNKGYILLSNKSISISIDNANTKSNIKHEAFNSKNVIFKKPFSWYEKPSLTSIKHIENDISELYTIDEILTGDDQIVYLRIKSRYIPADDIEFIEVNNSYKNYIYNMKFPYVELKDDTAVFNSIHFNEKTKLLNKLSKYSQFKIEGIEWLENGVPRLKINKGYISANLKYVVPKSNLEPIKNTIKRNELVYKSLTKLRHRFKK